MIGGSGEARGRGRRAVSVQVNWVLSLTITTLLISGLLIGMNNFLQTEREQVADSELTTLGNRIAADIAAADRLADQSDGTGRIEVRTELPEQIARSGYTVEVTSTHVTSADDDYYDVNVTLTATGITAEHTVTVRTEAPVAAGSLSGGRYAVVYDPADGELEVKNDD